MKSLNSKLFKKFEQYQVTNALKHIKGGKTSPTTTYNGACDSLDSTTNYNCKDVDGVDICNE